MNRLCVILGPTATGKTDLALLLAKKFNGEIISCDSRQVYKGLDIGAGKLPGKNVKIKKNNKFWQMDGIKVWMYDMVRPSRRYTVADYVGDAGEVIEGIKGKKKLPIIVGGSGFYLKALLEGLPNLSVPIDKKMRKELEVLSLEDLQKKLQQLFFTKWEALNVSDKQNPRRLIRAIEIMRNPYLEKGMSYKLKGMSVNILKIGLMASRETLYKKVDERVLTRIDQGMIIEAKKLNKAGLSYKRMRELGLEYGVLADYLQNKISSERLTIILQNKIHGYVRRQLTWFKKEKKVKWFNIEDQNYLKKVENQIIKWYYPSDA